MATERQTQHLKKKFLDAFREEGIVAAAARASGIDRDQVYFWKQNDPVFLAEFEVAEIESTESLEREMIRRAKGFDTEKRTYRADPETGEMKLVERELERKASDTLLIFALKARRPEVYRENQERPQAANTTVNVYPMGTDAKRDADGEPRGAASTD